MRLNVDRLRRGLRMLLELFCTVLTRPKDRSTWRRWPVRLDLSKTVLTHDEGGSSTILMSSEKVLPGPYDPREAAKGHFAFPIDVYAKLLRELPISSAIISTVAAIDEHGQCALNGRQPDGNKFLLLISMPLSIRQQCTSFSNEELQQLAVTAVKTPGGLAALCLDGSLTSPQEHLSTLEEKRTPT